MTIVDLTWDCPDFVCFAGSYSVCERSVVGFDQIVFVAFHVMPGGLIGLDWTGLTDAQAPARRFAADSHLGADGGRLMVEVQSDGRWRDGDLYSRLRDDPSPL